jgi:hypothetical protein
LVWHTALRVAGIAFALDGGQLETLSSFLCQTLRAANASGHRCSVRARVRSLGSNSLGEEGGQAIGAGLAHTPKLTELS